MQQVRFRDLVFLGVPYTRNGIMALCDRGSFPMPTKLSNSAVVWDRTEVLAWVAARARTSKVSA